MVCRDAEAALSWCFSITNKSQRNLGNPWSTEHWWTLSEFPMPHLRRTCLRRYLRWDLELPRLTLYFRTLWWMLSCSTRDNRKLDISNSSQRETPLECTTNMYHMYWIWTRRWYKVWIAWLPLVILEKARGGQGGIFGCNSRACGRAERESGNEHFDWSWAAYTGSESNWVIGRRDGVLSYRYSSVRYLVPWTSIDSILERESR